MNIFLVNIQVGELSGLVRTEGTTVADTLVGRPHVALQTVSSEALVVALVALELYVLVPRPDVGLQVSLLSGGVVTGRTLVDQTFMDRLLVTAEVEGCGGLILAALLGTDQTEPFMDNLHVLVEFGLLLG